ncbi:MAG: hypothetical protein KG003_03185 [Bacteroidetes bacterium]|nr:hypothetical protein [Bacteroidota bacterium]
MARKAAKPEEQAGFDSGENILNPKSKMILIQGEEIEIKKWNLGQLTELGTEIAQMVITLQDVQGDAGMVIAVLSSKLPFVNKVAQMTLNKDEEFCKTIDGDELLDLYEACSELNKSFFLRFKNLLPEGITNLVSNQKSPETSQETQEVGITGLTSLTDLQNLGTNSSEEKIPEENIKES